MTDREKVILDNLEYCRKNQNSNDCESCDYGGRSFQICERLVDDVIVLLKEQEPKPVLSERISEGMFHIEKKGFCPNCHQEVRWELNRSYCGFCGRAVKWDAGTGEGYQRAGTIQG